MRVIDFVEEGGSRREAAEQFDVREPGRLIVAFTWLWEYVTFQRGARLIEVPPERK
jgi:hypothetical protein